MRVLVTGSSGQLGGEIVRQLGAAHEALGLDRAPGPQTTHVGAITDRELVARLVRQVDIFIHTASLHARHLPDHDRRAFIDTNITGTQMLLEAAAEARVARVVYTSTTSLYGHALVPADRAVWVTEALAPRPRDIYDVTKLAAEQLCQLFHEETGIPARCLRVGRFFPEPPDRLAIYRLYRGLDVRDAARAHLLAATVEAPGCGVYTIAARTPFREEDCAELLRDAAAVIARRCPAVPPAFARLGWALPRSIDRVYAIDRAERELGYRPRHNIAEYLREYGGAPAAPGGAAG